MFVPNNQKIYNLKMKLFRNGTILIHQWPITYIFRIMVLRQDYIREMCCYCHKTMNIEKSSKTGDSGSVCPTCLRKENPEVYEDMKDNGHFTPEQIAEAEACPNPR